MAVTLQGSNVLLSKGGTTLKLADLGASKRIGQESIQSGLKGTPQWMAPEVVRGELSERDDGWIKADVWSVGCTVVEMLTGQNPWPNLQHPMAAMYRIGEGKSPPLDM
ncbi:unnamed protein product [Discosporangium mesarthrocarpum]